MSTCGFRVERFYHHRVPWGNKEYRGSRATMLSLESISQAIWKLVCVGMMCTFICFVCLPSMVEAYYRLDVPRS